MGGFYGSTHLRETDRDTVLAAAEKLAKRQKNNMLVGPALRGWVAVYPAGNGQDDRWARLLSKNLDVDAIHLLVHDDDIFAYSVFRGGKLIDQYNSNPDYFEPTPPKSKAKLRGQPEKLVDWLPDSTRLDGLRELLAAKPSTFASETMGRFAELMGLPNAVTAYEYLIQEETDDIERWEEFTHVPDLSEEEAEKLAIAVRQAATMRRLRDDGVLLLQEARPGKTRRDHAAAPYFCDDKAGGGFHVGWASGMNNEPIPLERYQPPWVLPAAQVGIDLRSTIWCPSSSPSGRFLAAGHASGDWKARLWDFQQRSLVLEVDHAHIVNWVGFSSDERSLVSIGSQDGFVTSLETHARVPLPIRDARIGAIHPDGTLVVSDEKGRLHLVDVDARTARKTLTLGDARALESRRQFQLSVRRQAYARLDDAEIERGYQEQIDQIEVTVQRMIDSSPKLDAAAAAEQARQFRERSLQSIEKARAQFATERESVATGKIDVGGSEKTFAMEISRDGRWLCLATMRGVRVFDWKAVAEAVDFLSDPVMRFDTASGPLAHSQQGYIYALAIHDAEQCLLFGGMPGTIDCLDLKTGGHRVLLDIPGKPTIFRMSLAGSGDALACCVKPEFLSQDRVQRPDELQIWNLKAIFRSGRTGSAE